MDDTIRDFLMELYIKHGEREFVHKYTGVEVELVENVIPYKLNAEGWALSCLTPAALEIIKNG